jgi:hypothetical protein
LKANAANATMVNMSDLPLPLIATILSILAILGCVYTLWNLWSLNKVRRALFTGATGEDLESVLQRLAQEMGKMHDKQTTLEHNLGSLEENFTFAIQKIGVVRFNPFQDGGGNFSFSLALLDSQNSGIILTSMHGREQNRIYTKKVFLGLSESPLTEEEQQALHRANQKEIQPQTKTKH